MTPKLPAITKIPSGRGSVVAVASGKGGVGKTWFAINLAHELAKKNLKVILFDGDLGLANVDIQLGLVPKFDLLEVLRGSVSLRDAVIAHAGGFDILSGRSGSGELSSIEVAIRTRIEKLIHMAAQNYDVVLVDLGAGLDLFVRKITASADITLIVATDEPTSLTDAYAVMKLHQLDRSGHSVVPQLVINFARSASQGMVTYRTLARASETFLGQVPPLLGILRRDDRVRDSIRRQMLLAVRHPGSDAACDVEGAAAQLSSSLTKAC